MNKDKHDCERPIYLSATSKTTVSTGEVVKCPEKSISVQCGTSEASLCEACSQLYNKRAQILVHNGLPTDAKTIAIFITLTAPSFQPVHLAVKERKGQKQEESFRCVCKKFHKKNSSIAGAPLDPKRYQYKEQIEWQLNVPKLWQQTKRAIKNQLEDLEEVKKTRFLLVRESQQRGAIHLHFIVTCEVNEQGIAAQRIAKVAKESLNGFIEKKGVVTRRKFVWGREAKFIALNPRQKRGEGSYNHVASYLAKYLTKDFNGDSQRMLYYHNSPIAKHRERLQEEVVTQLKRSRSEKDPAVFARKMDKAVKRYGYTGQKLSKSRDWALNGLPSSFKALKENAVLYNNKDKEAVEDIDIYAFKFNKVDTEDARKVIANWRRLKTKKDNSP